MAPSGLKPGEIEKPPPKKRGPKPKAPSARFVRNTPILKNSVFRSREKKLAVLTWIVQTRYPCAPLHPGRAGLVTEFGWRAPTDQEAADFFKIPATTINSWWRNRDVIMNQPKGSRIVRPRKQYQEEEQAEREASDESEFTNSGMDSGMAIDLTEEATPTPELPEASQQPTFLSTLNTIISFHPEAPPPRKTAPPPVHVAPPPQITQPSTPPKSVHRAPEPYMGSPPSVPRAVPRGFRAHINTLTAPPPRQTAPAESPPPHQTENVRVIYPEPPPSAMIEMIDPDLPTFRRLELPPPVIPQYPSFPTDETAAYWDNKLERLAVFNSEAV